MKHYSPLTPEQAEVLNEMAEANERIKMYIHELKRENRIMTRALKEGLRVVDNQNRKVAE